MRYSRVAVALHRGKCDPDEDLKLIARAKISLLSNLVTPYAIDSLSWP